MKARIIDTINRDVLIVFNGKEIPITANMAVVAELETLFGSFEGMLSVTDKTEALAKIFKVFFDHASKKMNDPSVMMSEEEILDLFYGDTAVAMQEVMFEAFREGGWIPKQEEQPEEDEPAFDDSMVPDDDEAEKN